LTTTTSRATITLGHFVFFQFNYPSAWSPKIVSTQLATIGPVVIACVPGEFTTMSGRRVRRAISEVLCGGESPQCIVVIAGLCNTYSDYITTPEEYKVNGSTALIAGHWSM
jgi:neutral ceramidase